MSLTVGTDKGVPHELNTSINYLALLLRHLPTDLPQDPETSTLTFGLDQDKIKEEGLGYAFNHCMEIAFQTHKNPLVKLNERGQRYVTMIQLFRDFHLNQWISRITDSAKVAGAKIPSKKRAVSPPNKTQGLQSTNLSVLTPAHKDNAIHQALVPTSDAQHTSVINLISDDECDPKKPSPLETPVILPAVAAIPIPIPVAPAKQTARATQGVVAVNKRVLSPANLEPNAGKCEK